MKTNEINNDGGTMKHFKKVIGAALLVAVPMLACVGLAQAQHFASTVEDGEVVQSSLYSSGKNVSVKGEVFGDVFCAGQNIRVDAIVHGDVLCAGMDVTIAGKVDGDIRAAGQSVSVSATATNVSLAGSDVSLDADAKVVQDLSAAGTKVNIKGEVGRDVAVNSSNVTLNGSVGRNVRASGTVTVKDGANIAGDLVYTSNKNASIANDASIAGKTQKTAQEKKGYTFDARFYFFVVIGLLFAVVALAALFPRFLQRTSDHAKQNIFKAFFIGALALVASVALMVALAFTVVGIPLAVLLLLGFLLACGLSAPITAFYLGRLVFSDRSTPLLMAAVGAVVLASLYFLPWLGFLFVILALGAGFGALLIELKGYAGKKTQPTTVSAGLTTDKPKKSKK